ncbi:MAG: hypothetical protein M1355_01115 [Patescibacteria group bacterium]|nr:hypothetical protein [Patescibacteria group bacterium]
MGYKAFLSMVTTMTVISGLAFLTVLFSLAPEKGFLSQFAFFASLFLFSAGLLTLVGFYGRRVIFGNEILYANVKVAFRQAIFLSLYLICILGLNSYKLLAFWDAILLFFCIILLEFYFKTRKIS